MFLKLQKIAFGLIISLTIIIAVCFIVFNFNGIDKASTLIAVALLLSILVLIYKTKLASVIINRFKKISSSRYCSILFILLVLGIGVALRLLIANHFNYSPTQGDTRTFVGIAANVGHHPETFDYYRSLGDYHGLVHNQFIAFYPYVALYTILLAGSFHVIPSVWLATIVLNIIFELLTCWAIWLAIRKILNIKNHPERSPYPLIAVPLYFLNPFTITFCLMSLPISLTNLFIALIILTASYLLADLATNRLKSVLVWSLLMGLAIGVGNWSRPIMTIFAIALAFTLIIAAKTKLNKSAPLALMGVGLVIITIIACSLVGRASLGQLLKTNVAHNPSGWSVFVGSNLETSGHWNMYDETKKITVCNNVADVDGCHNNLRQAGINRYQSYKLNDFLSLMAHKLTSFLGQQDDLNDFAVSLQAKSTKVYQLIKIYVIVFVISLFAVVVIGLKKLLVGSTNNNSLVASNILFLSLFVVGFVLSSLVFEVSNRYAQPLYPVVIVLFVVLLPSLFSRASSS